MVRVRQFNQQVELPARIGGIPVLPRSDCLLARRRHIVGQPLLQRVEQPPRVSRSASSISPAWCAMAINGRRQVH